MKNLIKQLLRENLLNEKLAEVDQDVDYLYDKFFKQDIDQVNKTGLVTKDMFKYDEASTSDLKTVESIKANEINPCIIRINATYKNSNFYSPDGAIIALGVNKSALDYALGEFGGDLKATSESLNGNQKVMFFKEFTEDRIKGSIHHELAHWLDDTMNNQHIAKRLKKSYANDSNYSPSGNDVVTTKMEIHGQIHNIKQAYNKFKDKWDTMTFNDLMSEVPTLNLIYNKLPPNLKTQWLKDLKMRMYREGLLGKNMVNLNESVLKSKTDKGNRYFEYLKTKKFIHYDGDVLVDFTGGEEKRKELVSKLSIEDKKKYKEWLKTKEGMESLKLWQD